MALFSDRQLVEKHGIGLWKNELFFLFRFIWFFIHFNTNKFLLNIFQKKNEEKNIKKYFSKVKS
jgi:hypothetical protein